MEYKNYEEFMVNCEGDLHDEIESIIKVFYPCFVLDEHSEVSEHPMYEKLYKILIKKLNLTFSELQDLFIEV